jgi:alpha 1,2-mannosyltransferase
MKLIEEKGLKFDKAIHGGGGRGLIYSALNS